MCSKTTFEGDFCLPNVKNNATVVINLFPCLKSDQVHVVIKLLCSFLQIQVLFFSFLHTRFEQIFLPITLKMQRMMVIMTVWL